MYCCLKFVSSLFYIKMGIVYMYFFRKLVFGIKQKYFGNFKFDLIERANAFTQKKKKKKKHIELFFHFKLYFFQSKKNSNFSFGQIEQFHQNKIYLFSFYNLIIITMVVPANWIARLLVIGIIKERSIFIRWYIEKDKIIDNFLIYFFY